MIIDVPAGASRRELRRSLLLAAEAMRPSKNRERSAKASKLEAKRMRLKVAGTKAVEAKIIKAVAGWESAVFKASGLKRPSKEADDSSDGTPDSSERNEMLDAVDMISTEPLFKSMWPDSEQSYDDGADAAATEIHGGDDQTPLVLDAKDAKAALRKRQLQFAADVSDDQKESLRELLLKAFDENIPTRDIAQVIADFFSDGIRRTRDDGTIATYDTTAWANTVARTEIAHAQNQGLTDYYREAGIRRIMWVAAADACDECADLDGEVTDLDDNFAGTDVSAPPEHPRCRCGVVAAGDDEGHTDAPFGKGQAATDGEDS